MYDKQRITRTTTTIAIIAALAVSLLIPAGFFAVSYQHLAGKLETESEMTSLVISDVVNNNPELWQYEQIRLEELLARRAREGHHETRRIFDRQDKLVAESTATLKPPLITRKFDLFEGGQIAGKLEIQSSLSPLLISSGLVSLIGIACGVAIFVTFRILPMRAVEEAEKSLLESRKVLQDKIALLEAALENIKQLEGIIPICMYCKKIRDDKESWQQIESYISNHTEAHFSHGICPECFRQAADETMKELENLKNRTDEKRDQVSI